MEEVGTLTWRDPISHNIANMRLKFGKILNRDFIFTLYNSQLLSLRQSQYIENLPKCISFSILGFFQLGVKLGFDFPKVSPNKKTLPRSLNFDFDEESNPMLGLLKNSSSVRSPNFSHQKLKMPGIESCFDEKMRPLTESQPSILLMMDYGERPKK